MALGLPVHHPDQQHDIENREQQDEQRDAARAVDVGLEKHRKQEASNAD
jgi:hypothetical protein